MIEKKDLEKIAHPLIKRSLEVRLCRNFIFNYDEETKHTEEHTEHNEYEDKHKYIEINTYEEKYSD